MLITSLLPLLARYSLGCDLVAGPGGMVTLTIIPRMIEGGGHKPDAGELRPIALTASAAEIDAELARGENGALGQLIAGRKALADQLEEQRQATQAARAAAAAKAKAATPTPKPTPKPVAAGATAHASGSPPGDAKPEEPASLW